MRTQKGTTYQEQAVRMYESGSKRGRKKTIKYARNAPRCRGKAMIQRQVIQRAQAGTEKHGQAETGVSQADRQHRAEQGKKEAK